MIKFYFEVSIDEKRVYTVINVTTSILLQDKTQIYFQKNLGIKKKYYRMNLHMTIQT